MPLSATTNVTLAGGLRDQDAATSSLSEFIPEIWGASIMDYMEKNLTVAKLATDQSAMVANGGDRIHMPRQTELTATDTYGAGVVETLIGTGLAFPATGNAEDAYTLDIDQAIHSAIAITDVARVQSSYDVMNMYTQKLGYALAKKIDGYVSLQLLEHVGFNHSNTTGDGAGSGNIVLMNGTHDSYDILTLGVANMIEAIYANDSSIDDYTMVLTPKCYASLFKLGDFARYDGVGNSFGTEVPFISGFAGKLGGVKVVIGTNFQSYDAGAADISTNSTPIGNFSSNSVDNESELLLGYLVHKDALHIAYARGMKARVQSDYNLESLSTRFVADSVYGCLTTGTGTAGNQRVFALCSPAS